MLQFRARRAAGRRAHQRDGKLVGKRRDQVAHGDEAHIDQNLAELVAAFFLQFEGAVEIFLFDQAAFEEHFT